MPTFTTALSAALDRTAELASHLRHAGVGIEHLMLCLLDEPDAAATLRACNVDFDRLRQGLIAHLEKEPLAGDGKEAKFTTALQRVVQRAVVYAEAADRPEVTGANVLIALMAERCEAFTLLQQQSMSRFDAVVFVSHGITKLKDSSGPNAVRE